VPRTKKSAHSTTAAGGCVDRRALKIVFDTCLSRLNTPDAPLPDTQEVAASLANGVFRALR
jgi:hypothetical protein